MSPSLKSALTLGVLLGLLIVGAVWGWRAFTRPVPTAEDPPLCENDRIAAGTRVLPEDVTVSVFNASQRVGLAGFTMEQLVSKGFAQGESGNAPDGTDIQRVEVWAEEPDGPAALLVSSYLGKDVEVRETVSALGPGVVVVVGEDFKRVRKGERFVTAEEEATVCTPTS